MMIIYALNINGAVGFEYNANIVSSNTAVGTSIYEGRRNTVVFFVVGHFVFYTSRVYGEFRIFGHNSTDISRLEFLDITLRIYPGGSGLGLLPFAALSNRSAGGFGSRSAKSGASSAVASSGASSSSSPNESINLCNSAFLDLEVDLLNDVLGGLLRRGVNEEV
jgi:hypothetical protein